MSARELHLPPLRRDAHDWVQAAVGVLAVVVLALFVAGLAVIS